MSCDTDGIATTNYFSPKCVSRLNIIQEKWAPARRPFFLIARQVLIPTPDDMRRIAYLVSNVPIR